MQALQGEIKKQTINNVIGNFLGHAGITYWVKYNTGDTPALGAQGYIADFLITGLLFSGILGGVFIVMFRRRAQREGFIDATPTPWNRGWLPQRTWPAVGVLSFYGLCSVALPLALYVLLWGTPALSPMAVALTKGVWAALAAAVIVPVAGYHGATVHPA